MKYRNLSRKITGVLFLMSFTAMVFNSCVPVNRLAYVQSESPGRMQFSGEPFDDLIRPGDELFVRITSADDGPTAIMVQDQGRMVMDPTLLSHTVSDDGTIKLPYIGRIYLAELTLEEASDEIERALGDYLFIPSVYIRFVNTKVTVLGEVRNPGVFVSNYKNINVLQAIAYANDITEFGNRRNVLIVREEDGMNKTKQYIDLTSDNILESEFYQLKSNDIVYVEPLRRKKWGMAAVPYNLILSLVTTTLVVMTYMGNRAN
jgi:polysaccharide biosynthesis/export protein